MKTFLLCLLFVLLNLVQPLYAQQSSKDPCLVVAHRGASKIAPENTVASAKLGWELGADAVEIDVHLTSDNQVVVIHDYGTKRTSGKDYKISETPYEKIKDLDVGSWKGEKFKGEKIPLLEDVVSAIPKDKLLVIEIKSDKKIVPFIHEKLKGHPKAGQFIFIAFNYETILDAKKAFPKNRAFWLSGSFKEDTEIILSKVKADGLDGVDLHYRMITPDLIKTATELELEVHTWTVNDLGKAIELKTMGVWSITTDTPDKVLEVLSLKD